MSAVIDALIGWPERVARHLDCLAPLFARITVGYVFMLTGWGKLHNLPQVIENFAGWGIPYPNVLTPFVAGDTFTQADCAAFASLPIVAMATRIVYGADLLAAAGVDWKSHGKLVGERPSAQRVTADRKADQERAAATKAA